MNLRLSSKEQRTVIFAASFAAAFTLSYFSIRNALAVHCAGEQTPEAYQRAARLEPAAPRNWYLLGRYWQYNLQDPVTARAICFYLSAPSLNPASSETLLDLATAYESEVNLAAARDVFLRAKKAYPFSAEASWRYGNFLLRQGELEPAFAEMRLAVRADPHRAAEAFSRALRSGSSLETAIDRVLPPISEAYLDVIWDQTKDLHTGNALSVGGRLVSLHPRISLYKSFPLVDALITERQLHALGTQDNSTAVTSEVHGSAPWTRMELPWSSGKDVQELQVCLVRFPSEEAENKIQGTAWVDDVALVPEPGEHPEL
jgi:tetratricopeptide (TPR) repeat protein